MENLKSKIAQMGGKVRFMLVSDLDHTMVDHDDPEHARLKAFNDIWQSQMKKDSLLVFSTGRSPVLYEQLRTEAPMLQPDILVCSVGTEVMYVAEDGSYEPDTVWEAELDQGWDRAKVTEITAGKEQLKLQSDTEQRPHKVSFNVAAEEAPQIVADLEKQLQAAGLSCKLIYSGGQDLDILPANASKGHGLAFLLKKAASEGWAPDQGVQVNGDSGNDQELFEVDGVYGCIVSNAKEELRKYGEEKKSERINMAEDRCAGGIVETMKKFGFAT